MPLYTSDYNECVDDNAGCDQICVNTIPGYYCDCNDGYSLDSDNITCVANADCSDGVCTCLDGFMNESGTGECVGEYIVQILKFSL